MIRAATMPLMRDLQRQHRITARSVPEVIGPMERALSFYGESRSITFRGRKLSNEAFINAAILHMVSLPEAEQERALAAALGRLEAILVDDGEAPLEGVPGVGGVAEDVSEQLAPKRRNRAGRGV